MNNDILEVLWSALHRTEQLDYWLDYFGLASSDVDIIKSHDLKDIKDIFDSNLSLFRLNIPKLSCTARNIPAVSKCSSAFDLHFIDKLNLIKLKFLIVCRYLAIIDSRMARNIFDLSKESCSFLTYIALDQLADLANQVSLVSRCDFAYLKHKNDQEIDFFPKIKISVY